MKSVLARLMLVVAVALVPAVGLQIFNEAQARKVRQQLIEDEAMRYLHLVRAEQTRIIEGAEQTLDVIAASTGVQDHNPAVCRRLTTNLLKETARYSTADVMTLDGTPFCTPEGLSEKFNVADRPYFRLALQTGGTVIGEYAIGRSSGEPTLHIARPVRNADGIVFGVAAVGLSLQWLNQQIASLDLPPGSIVGVADRNGTFLARYPDGMLFTGRPRRSDRHFRLEGNTIQVIHSITSLDQGRPMLAALSPSGADPYGLVVAVSLDEETAFAQVARADRTGLVLILTATILAAAFAATAGYRFFRRPIDRLLSVAEQWQRGNTSARSGLQPDRSEFGRLAEAFDHMAEAQQSQNHFLRNALGVPAAVAMFDTKMHYIAVSARFVRDYHIPQDVAETIIGRSHYEVFPDIPDKWRANNRRVLAGETLSAEEDSFPRADGHTDWIHWEMAPWRNSDGTIGGLVLYCEIVTGRREAQLTLRRLTEDLEARVQQEVAAREAALARAAHAERLQALGQLAGGIAHDFNNVLQSIGGAASLIDRRAGDATATRRLVRQVLDATARGAGITGRLLAFGRKGDLRPTKFNVAGLLGDLRELLAHTLGAGIDVEVTLEDEHLAVSADRSQTETILVNLATNARDAMPNGGRLTLSAQIEADPAQQAGLAPGRYVRIDVTDTGTGMDAPTYRRACEPFFTTKGVGIGTGLGLSMAKGFAEQSGGTLYIATSPGCGCTVSLWLQAAGASAPKPVPPVEPPRPARSVTARYQVLLVDDEEPVREVMAEALEDAGHVVHIAASGQEALDFLNAGETVDIVVTDLSMPGMNGIALIRDIQRRWPAMPAVLLTGYASDTAALALCGVSTCSFSLLRKPVRIEDLADRIETLLAEHVRCET